MLSKIKINFDLLESKWTSCLDMIDDFILKLQNIGLW